jgi:hypothetical protein
MIFHNLFEMRREEALEQKIPKKVAEKKNDDFLKLSRKTT